MDKSNYSEFLEKMVGLAEVLGPKELSETILTIYWKVLKNLSIEDFRNAVNIVASSNKFFPKPAELIAAVAPDSEGMAIVAYDRVMDAMSIGTYETICFDDPAINAAISSMGGWIEFGKKENNEWTRKDFYKAYQVHSKRIKAGNLLGIPTKLVGIIEVSNADVANYEQNIIYIGDKKKCLEWNAKAKAIKGNGNSSAMEIIKLLGETKKDVQGKSKRKNINNK